jgi:di-N-acetylchitobiase
MTAPQLALVLLAAVAAASPSVPSIHVVVAGGSPSDSPPCACADAALCKPLAQPAAAREVFAFIDKNATWPHLDYTTMTTVCAFERPVDVALVCHAHSRGVRVVMSAPFNVSQIEDAAARTAWVQGHLALVQKDGLDGLNLDIEQYHGKPEPLTALVTELFHALKGWNPHTQLSFDLSILPAGQSSHYDHGKLAKVLDFIVPMAYDEPWNTKVAAANSPIAVIAEGIAQYSAAGVPASKLVVGLPWYGWDYPCNTTVGVCDVVPPAGQKWMGWATQVGYSNILTLLRNSSEATVTTDQVSMSKHFDYTVASGKTAAAGRHQCWFDDPETLEKKYAECKQQGARGVAFWTADMPDYQNGEGAAMWQAVDKGFPKV